VYGQAQHQRLMVQKMAKTMLHAQTVSGEALSVLNEVFLTQALGRCPLNIWVFVANITNVFTLELDILRAYDACVDLGHEALPLEEEGVSLWILVAGPGIPAR
jgi:hypothetical protein